MTTTATSLTPLKAMDRIHSLDVIRGIVLFGILLMNINGMGLAHAYGDPTVSGGSTGWDLYTWIATNMFFEGTMRALFSLLFGVGMFILLDRLENKGAGLKAADIYFRRLLWLLFFGLVHGYLLLWTGEILYQYALMGFLVYSFRYLSPKKLILIALFLFSVGALWSYFDYTKDVKFMEDVALVKTNKSEGKTLTKELKETEFKWENKQWERSPEGVKDYNNNMRKSYLNVVAFLGPTNQHYDENWPYRYDLWDVLSMMLLGIALFKLNILSAEKSYKFYFIMATLGYLVGLTTNYFEINYIMNQKFSLLSFSKTNITYDLGRVGVAMGHVGLIMLFCKSSILKWLKNALSAVGKMALTNYVMHSVFAMFIFTGAGFALFGTFKRHELLYIVFSIWLFQLIASPLWLKYFQFGPLEWLWRNLSYKKRHALKK
ncbi:uncharacterized protein SAMN05428642_103454 [Flaviramulus basaltis]|uniref:DUF418 domain-containing protein n=1 Tax=Flaviramulus basaltis TaxID=369401 RepID=A0A1K2INW9_9FLAO|nr:DUF418 domain-containing protein [Flaviramulus basaltis]SFZ93954.1 uncharacterized protein SAMN05428642_103454 [Flaviramulus basaltis]